MYLKLLFQNLYIKNLMRACFTRVDTSMAWFRLGLSEIRCTVMVLFCNWIKTPRCNNGEYEVRCECDECFIILRDVAYLLLTKADLFLTEGR